MQWQTENATFYITNIAAKKKHLAKIIVPYYVINVKEANKLTVDRRFTLTSLALCAAQETVTIK